VLYDYEYLASYRDWMVSGDVYGWNFRIVHPKGDIASTAIFIQDLWCS
jgi:hypothetical protein